jgi:hypothetical protein
LNISFPPESGFKSFGSAVGSVFHQPGMSGASSVLAASPPFFRVPVPELVHIVSRVNVSWNIASAAFAKELTGPFFVSDIPVGNDLSVTVLPELCGV